MKKFLFVLFILFTLTFVVACGEKEDTKTPDVPTVEEPTPENPTQPDEPTPEVKEFTVKFVVDGKESEVKVKENEKVAKPSDPVKEGYKFVGWYADSEYSAEYDFESAVTKEVTIYAKFEEEVVLEYLTPEELKVELEALVKAYVESLTATVLVDLVNGDEKRTINLAYEYTEEGEVKSLQYDVQGVVPSHIYVKKGVVYTLSNGVTSQEDLTSSSSELFINSYKVQEIVLKAIKFYDEAEFYNALEVVSYENGVCKYKLNLNAYNGTKVNAVGKESIELNVTYDEKEIVAIEFVSQKIGSTDSVKVEFKGLGKPSIAYPEDLSSYGK